MIFWITAALLALLAMASVVFPLLRKRGEAGSLFAYDRELYKARLKEIDTDLELGRIAAAEAEAARAEEGRKLLALSDTKETRSNVGKRERWSLVAAAAVFVPLASTVFYLQTGNPAMPDMSIASRLNQDPTGQSIEQLLGRAEAQLAKNPDDVKGWSVVAPVYMRLGRVEDAVLAYRNAVRLNPGDVDLKTSLGEAMVVAEQGIVTEDAKHWFTEAIKQRPNDPKARFFLAIALGQEGKLQEAADAWRGLIGEAPQDAPWLPVAKAQLGQVMAQLSGAGPTKQDVEAAAEMPAGDRQEMIRTMVANLAEKLKADPSDKDGWRRLIRSWAVLGDQENLKAALADAKAAFPDDAAFMGELETVAAEAPPLPPQAKGPSKQDVEAAANMPAADRQEMIRGMVANLAEKLKADPSDKDGWRRLIRSWTVLGDKEKLAASLADAGGAFPEDAAFLAELDAIAGAAGPTGNSQ
ncbi:MAG: c-type cytochrome biogenesis protein CcmI [Nitratireductor sp.]|nr:c-type cytochrome biogenesis protein CcmI [Nitratireductor sp.]